jgi:hypothetical protein
MEGYVTTDRQPPADEVTQRLMHLRGMLGDLRSYIRREAEDLAEPMIRDAEARARLAIVEATGETQRQRELAEELGRRLRAADKRIEEAANARRVLAAALREHPGALPLSYFVGRVVELIEQKESESG